MPFTDEEKAELLAEFQAAQAAQPAAPAPAPEQSRASIVGTPDVAEDAGPEFWVHLANGDVVKSHDSSSTHVEVDGKPVLVIGRFQTGE